MRLDTQAYLQHGAMTRRAPSLWPDTVLVNHPANTAGRDFVIGDLHGCFDTVEHALGELGYLAAHAEDETATRE